MIVFCPNCGTQNAGLPGARARCTACASTFDVPSESGSAPLPSESPRVATTAAEGFAGPSVPAQIARVGGQKTNALAVVSLVSGVLCCVPFLSPGLALGCGLGALKQIDAAPSEQTGRGLAIAGILLGAITALVQLLGIIGALSRRV